MQNMVTNIGGRSEAQSTYESGRRDRKRYHPARLVSTTTSNESGRVTSFRQRSSTITSSAFSSGYSLRYFVEAFQEEAICDLHDIRLMPAGDTACSFLLRHFGKHT